MFLNWGEPVLRGRLGNEEGMILFNFINES
jgi:hypothetical protein